jgi:Family of unknown function (DUF6504)
MEGGVSMTRRYREPITVRVLHGQPVAFTWRHRSYGVRVLGRWRLLMFWWDPQRASNRVYYRVQTRTQQVFELYRDGTSGAWVLDTCYE